MAFWGWFWGAVKGEAWLSFLQGVMNCWPPLILHTLI